MYNTLSHTPSPHSASLHPITPPTTITPPHQPSTRQQQELQDDLLWVVEQIPNKVTAADLTHALV